jgi:hypothetical protein
MQAPPHGRSIRFETTLTFLGFCVSAAEVCTVVTVRPFLKVLYAVSSAVDVYFGHANAALSRTCIIEHVYRVNINLLL